jgi:hypothetical protein
MDVHKESTDIAIADEKEAHHFGRIGADSGYTAGSGSFASVNNRLLGSSLSPSDLCDGSSIYPRPGYIPADLSWESER